MICFSLTFYFITRECFRESVGAFCTSQYSSFISKVLNVFEVCKHFLVVNKALMSTDLTVNSVTIFLSISIEEKFPNN